MNEQLVYLAQIAVETGENLDYWKEKHPGILEEALKKVDYFHCAICQEVKRGKHVNVQSSNICFACGDEISEKLQGLVNSERPGPDDSQLQLWNMDNSV